MGWQEGDIWKRSDGEGQASQDCRESIPCRSHQAVHLDPGTLFSAASQVSLFQLLAVGIPRDRNFGVALVQLLKITPCLRNCMFPCRGTCTSEAATAWCVIDRMVQIR